MSKDKITLDEFQKDVGVWSDKTFGTTSDEIKNHLADEMIELIGPVKLAAALNRFINSDKCKIDELNDKEESSDVLLLLLHLAHKEKFSLMDGSIEKQEINIGRNWGKKNASGIIRHED